MRTFLFLMFVTSLTGLNNKLSAQSKSYKTANEVLERLSDKINSLTNISYEYYRSINYFSENYHHETSASSYLDFNSGVNVIGFKYQFESDQYKMIYNGAESFYLNKKDKTLKITNKPKLSDFSSLSFFVNSIVTLKNALPKIITDKEITKALTDTIISDKNHFLISLLVKNKSLNGLGTFIPVTLQRNFIYKIIIDKDTYLPVQVIQINNVEPKDYMLTSFSNFKLDNNKPPDNSWYYSSYANEFKPAIDKVINLIKPNSIAPDWQLPMFATSETLTLNELKGKVVLLEFWIKNCSYCIAAVPKLNSIAKKYVKNKNFEIVGVNPHDTKEDINNFYVKNKPNFKTVYDEGKVTTEYGVSGFPTVVLINKKGKVLYSGNFDQQVLEPLIKSALR